MTAFPNAATQQSMSPSEFDEARDDSLNPVKRKTRQNGTRMVVQAHQSKIVSCPKHNTKAKTLSVPMSSSKANDDVEQVRTFDDPEVDEEDDGVLTIDQEHQKQASHPRQLTRHKRKEREEPIQGKGKRSSLHSELILQEIIFSIILFRIIDQNQSGSRWGFVDNFEARSRIRWSSGV